MDLNFKLIEAVKRHECLYNMHCPQYKQFTYKEHLWTEIEKEIGKSSKGFECKKMWKNLRDTYKRTSKRKNAWSKPYKYAEALRFLDDFYSTRSSQPISSLSANAEVSTDISSGGNEFKYQPPKNQTTHNFENILDDVQESLDPSAHKELKTENVNMDTKIDEVPKIKEEILTETTTTTTTQKNSNIKKSKKISIAQSWDMRTNLLNLTLIEAVKKHECLYNVQCPQYKHVAYKKLLWTEIAKEIGITDFEAKRNWKVVRDNYRRSKQAAILQNGNRKPYKYAEVLRFLDDFSTDRNFKFTALASDDAEVSTDLSTDDEYQPKTKKQKFDEHFDDFQGFSEVSSDENSKTKTFNPETNLNEVNLTPQKYNDTRISTEQVEEHLIENSIDRGNDDMQSVAQCKNLKISCVESLGTQKNDLIFKLIKEVQQNECLYNVQSPQYKQCAYKNRLWKKIGKKIGKTDKEAKIKWKRVRDSYKRYKKTAIIENGFRKPYKYAEALRFLDDFSTDRSINWITPTSDNDEDVSTDLSSDYEIQYHHPDEQATHNSFDNTFQDIGDVLGESSIDENSKSEILNPDTNTDKKTLVNEENSTTQQKNKDNEDDLTVSIEDKIKENHLNEKLIEEVKKYECMYNTRSPQFRHFSYKQRLWHKIGKRLGMTDIKAKMKWRGIRDSYKRYKKTAIVVNGSRKPYKYAEAMRFIDDFSTAHNTITPASDNDEDVSTDLSSDYEIEYHHPDEQENHNVFDNTFQDIGDVLGESSIDENSKSEILNPDNNADKEPLINEENSTTQQKNKDNEDDVKVLIEDKVKEQHLNEKLIEEVKKHECIYNTQLPQYRHFSYKQRLWHKIGKRLGMTDIKAKMKWRGIRDTYKRYKKTAIVVNGFRKPYKYAEAIRFIDDFSTARNINWITPASDNDEDVSTDLSTDYEIEYHHPDEQATHNVFDNTFEDIEDVLKEPSIDENTKSDILNPDNNTDKELLVNEENSTTQQLNKDNEYDVTVSIEDKIKENQLNEKLIEEVKKHECMYNTRSPQFRHFSYKQRLWHKIGKRLGLTGVKACKKWYWIRDAYRQSKLKSLNANRLVHEHKYAESLKFLDNFLTLQPCAKRRKLHQEPEVSTDLSSDSDLLQESPTTNQQLSALPSATEIVTPSAITNRLFQLLANKINKATLTAEEKNEIEYTVSSVVYSKLAEFNRNKTKSS